MASCSTPQSGAWQFAPQVSLPIFDAGRNEANLALARIRKDLALAEYEKAIQVAFREVADVLAGQILLERDLAVRIQIRDGEASRLALTTTRYQAGSIGYLDMLDAERGLFAAEQQLVDARRARLENAINLYRALGWRAPGGAHIVLTGYSTVTLLARFRGWSTSVPLSTAM